MLVREHHFFTLADEQNTAGDLTYDVVVDDEHLLGDMVFTQTLEGENIPR